jgi:hypothetical protein
VAVFDFDNGSCHPGQTGKIRKIEKIFMSGMSVLLPEKMPTANLYW